MTEGRRKMRGRFRSRDEQTWDGLDERSEEVRIKRIPSFFYIYIFFYIPSLWNIVDLHCHVSFRYTAK